MKSNVILQGDVLERLKDIPDQSINCVMTSPPYWALRDYGTDVETIWDGTGDCEHEWITGKAAGDTRIEKRSKSRAGWVRPSRIEFANRDVKNVCPVCNEEFEGKPNQKFCSTKCLNTLSNEERTSTPQTSNFCSKCQVWKGQLGLEPTFDLYIKHLCDIFDEVKRVLRKDGTCWINLGDTYSGNKVGNTLDTGTLKQKQDICKQEFVKTVPESVTEKSLCMIPFRFAIEMVNRGWILRNTIIWHKPNCMPSSAKDRFTVDFEYIFFFTKNKKYWFETQYEKSITGKSKIFNSRVRDVKRGYIKSGHYKASEKEMEQYHGGQIITQPNKNKRTVWKIPTQPFPEAHFAVYPEAICETPIRAGCPEFVCNKCGGAREKIMVSNNPSLDIINETKDTDTHYKAVHINKTRSRDTIASLHRQKGGVYSTAEFKGLTNCNCNAGFSGGIVLDPFFGAGTTGLVALKQNKKFIGIEINPEYIKIAEARLKPFLEQRKLHA